ncbi:copper amine oxidase N-terminal domain-containing protein [Paenibacillus pasadenensis]|uniref:copper amine oxidase N-terminal domain-containing protein n=1 Tax=Paenibacillus pasadenensis TaxID=217090 RepID=UPI00048E6F46|nr:copper amine oxidase N-terminal domain-containing protein [Paenibacillus pasadenensis]
MWNLLKIAVLAALLGFIAQPFSAQAAASQATTQSVAFETIFDGRTLEMPHGQYLFSHQGTSYVPIRYIAYGLLQSVQWNASTATVSVSKPTDKELVVLREYFLNAIGASGTPASIGNQKLTIKPAKVSFVFYGAKKQLPAGQTAYMLNNSLYVPIRFMSESTGMNVKWDSSSKRITITSPASVQPKEPEPGNPASENAAGSDNSGAGGNTSGVAQGGGIVIPSVPTYEDVKFRADAKLQTLYMNAKTTFLKLGQQYVDTSDKSKRAALKKQGEDSLTSFTSQFDSLVSQVEAELTKYGYSTSIIQEYRQKFNEELNAGKELMSDMLKG